MGEQPVSGQPVDEPVGGQLGRLANLRDVAQVAHPAPGLRRGALWRSSQPLAGDVEPTEVDGWPPRTVVDLRSAAEVPGAPRAHPLGTATTAVHAVPLLDDAGSPQELAARAPTLHEVYLSMLDPGTGLVRAVTLVAEEPAPVLVHCAAGKDRTGLVVALVLRLVGVGREAVLEDFALTTAAMPAVMARALALAPLPPGTSLADVPREYLEAPVEALTDVLDRWDDAPGGVEGWARARGAGPQLAQRLRGRLLA